MSISSLPNHIAIIMDGNGRWAQGKGLPRIAGHKKGAEVIRTILQTCQEIGIKYLTIYAFSTENWKRPEAEVTGLMKLLKFYLANEFENLKKNKVRFSVIGEIGQLKKSITQQIIELQENTKVNDGINFNVALNYGGRQEITQAAQNIAKLVKENKLQPDEINESTFASCLYTSNIPDPDLLIRTGGEQRLSNFLLWQLAYTEFFFTETLWPDFNTTELKQAINEFQNRERRYGKA